MASEICMLYLLPFFYISPSVFLSFDSLHAQARAQGYINLLVRTHSSHLESKDPYTICIIQEVRLCVAFRHLAIISLNPGQRSWLQHGWYS